MRCNFCGSELPENATVCHDCGMAVVNSNAAHDFNDYVTAENVGPNKGKVPGIIGMIIGILAMIGAILFGCCWCGCGGIGLIISSVVVLLLGIVGLILSIVGLAKSKASGHKNGFAVVGLILSIVSAVFAVIAAVVGVVLLIIGGASFAADFMEGFMYGYDYGYDYYY